MVFGDFLLRVCVTGGGGRCQSTRLQENYSRSGDLGVFFIVFFLAE